MVRLCVEEVLINTLPISFLDIHNLSRIIRSSVSKILDTRVALNLKRNQHNWAKYFSCSKLFVLCCVLRGAVRSQSMFPLTKFCDGHTAKTNRLPNLLRATLHCAMHWRQGVFFHYLILARKPLKKPHDVRRFDNKFLPVSSSLKHRCNTCSFKYLCTPQAVYSVLHISL